MDEINERNLEFDASGTSRSISKLHELRLESSDDELENGPRLQFINYDISNPRMLSQIKEDVDEDE